MNRVENFKEKLNILPKSSGCYLYYNEENEVIYVGKSKNLYNRVNSYFNRVNNLKTTLLVDEIFDFNIILTDNEADSLILELNLIKQYFPKYNIKLMDDSSYPYIEITSESHPKLIYSRKPKSDRRNVFGPYPNSRDCSNVVSLLNRIYPLRKCKKIPDRSCIYYQMDNCLAPCIKKVNRDDYQEIIIDIKNFLKGSTKKTIDYLENKMNLASENLDFELALTYRDLIKSCRDFRTNKTVDSNDQIDRDIFSYYESKGSMCINVLYVRDGKIVASDNKIFTYVSAEETFKTFVSQHYALLNSFVPTEILLSTEVEGLAEFLGSKVLVPKIGEKQKIVELSKRNAMNKLIEEQLLIERVEKKTTGAMLELNEALNTNGLRTIEMFDNSSLSGTNAVSAMVRFIDGKKDTSGYRKYNIKTVINQDDFATMREVIYRRYFRLLMESKELPDILIVDGGKGQLTQALKVMQDLNITSIKVIGLQKNDSHKTELIIDSDYNEIKVSKNSFLFKLLETIQEESHRFAITFHRSKRSKESSKSILDEIPGIGAKRKTVLLKSFKSIDEMSKATNSEYKKIGFSEKQANIVRNFLKEKINNEN